MKTVCLGCKSVDCGYCEHYSPDVSESTLNVGLTSKEVFIVQVNSYSDVWSDVTYDEFKNETDGNICLKKFNDDFKELPYVSGNLQFRLIKRTITDSLV